MEKQELICFFIHSTSDETGVISEAASEITLDVVPDSADAVVPETPRQPTPSDNVTTTPDTSVTADVAESSKTSEVEIASGDHSVTSAEPSEKESEKEAEGDGSVDSSDVQVAIRSGVESKVEDSVQESSVSSR